MTAYVFKRKRPPVLQYTGDYTKVGSPTITDNVVSGFSSSNYLKIPQTFNPSSKTWEWNFKFTMGSDVSTTAYILGCTNTSGSHGAMLGMVYGKFTCWLSANGTSWNIVTDGTTTTALVAGETYYVKFGWTGTEYYIDISTNGIDYEREYTLASTTAVHSSTFNIGSAWHLTNPFKGSIDLTESYIKINGEYWWRGAKYVNADKCFVLKRKRPTEYLKYGDTTSIVNLAASNNSSCISGSNFHYYVYHQSTTQSYTLNTPIKTKKMRLKVSALNQANCNSGFSVVAYTTSGEYDIGSGEFGGGSNETREITYDFDGLKEITGFRIYGTSGAWASSYCYGGVDIAIYSQSLTQGTEDDYDYKIGKDSCYVLKRKQYWKYEYKDWEQPVLTANGALGGDSFAVKMSEETGTNYAYQAFDGKEDTLALTGYTQPQWLMMYNPNPLNVSKIEYILRNSNYWATSLDIQASDDGSDSSWVTLLSLSGLVKQDYVWDIDTGGKFYKYYRLYIKSANRTDPNGNTSRPAHISELKLTAQEQITVKATKDDYDFITD